MSPNITPHKLRLLAGLLAMPGEDGLAVIAELALTESWLLPAVAELTTAPWNLHRWQGECTRLFINGHPKTVCPPFESSYIHGYQNGAACDELLHIYQYIGLQPQEDIFPDYLGIILEAAAYLAEQDPFDAETWELLWQPHVVRWVPRFAKDLQDHSHLQFYRLLGVKLQELF
jgi:TorA maturation chaperone TorD